MMAGFHPGGYSGIQQTGRGRHAIFSLWDGGEDDKAQNVWYNKEKGVTLHNFGGEGTGGKSFMDYNWKDGKTYTMEVEGKVKNGVWTVKNNLRGNGQSFSMAEFSVRRPPLTVGDFSAFIEDFGTEGCHVKRDAEYFDPKMSINGKSVPVSEAKFAANKAGSGKEVILLLHSAKLNLI